MIYIGYFTSLTFLKAFNQLLLVIFWLCVILIGPWTIIFAYINQSLSERCDKVFFVEIIEIF